MLGLPEKLGKVTLCLSNMFAQDQEPCFGVMYCMVFHLDSLWPYLKISSRSISNEVKEFNNIDNRTAPVDAADDEFWEQFWSDSVNSVQVNRELDHTRSQSYKKLTQIYVKIGVTLVKMLKILRKN